MQHTAAHFMYRTIVFSSLRSAFFTWPVEQPPLPWNLRFGSRIVKVELLPGSFSTVMSAPIMRASLRQRAKPAAAEAMRGRGIGLSKLLEQFTK
jgi:hypothetical protein